MIRANIDTCQTNWLYPIGQKFLVSPMQNLHAHACTLHHTYLYTYFLKYRYISFNDDVKLKFTFEIDRKSQKIRIPQN